MNQQLTPSQVAQAYAESMRGRVRASYVGGGRIRVASLNTPTLVVRYVTVPAARAHLAGRAAQAVA